MAQCRAEERKHHSAMDMYVGILHSKLHNPPSMEAEKYQHWSGYGSSAENFRKEPTSTNKNSHYIRSFREDPDLKPKAHAMKQDATPVEEASSRRNGRYGSINVIKSSPPDEELSQPIHATKKYDDSNKSAMDPMEPSDKARNCMDFNNEKLCDSRDYPQSQMMKSVDLASSSASIFRAHDSGDLANHSVALNSEKLYDSRGFPQLINTGKVKKALVSDPHADDPITKGSTMEPQSQKKPGDVATAASNGLSLRSHDSPRTHKSAEQTVVTSGRANSGNFGNNTRLYKSGEQMNANVNKESNQGGLIVGGADSSPTTNVKEGGRRWSSTGSVDYPPIFMGLSSNAKDGDRRASFNGGFSVSDGGSPVAKDLWRRSSTGGYGSADSSCPGGAGHYTKDLGSRSNVLNNNKDTSSNVSLRGMGNILGGGNMNGNLGKPKASSASKPGCADKVESCVVKKLDDVTFPSSHPINSNLGNICAGGRWNPSVPTGNILNHGSISRSSNRIAEEPKHGVCQMDDPEEIKNAGNELYKKGNFAEAVAFYDRSIAMCPNHAPYRSNRAAALIGLGRLGEAVQECEEAIRLDPRYARAHHRAAYLYVRLGLIESAKRHLAVTCQADAKEMQNLQTVERHISKCIEARKMGNWRNTLSESNAAIAAGADSAPQILGYKSEALLKLHKQEEAEVVCAEALKLEASLCKLGVVPADSFLHMLRAHIEMSLGRFDDAIHAAESAVKLDPRNPEAVGLLRKAHAVGQTRRVGNKLFNAGKFFEACAAYGEGLESDPTNAVLLCNRAACRSKIGQWEKAIEDCNAALNAQPNYIKALMRRANCSSKLEQWEDALRDYEVLRRELPNDMVVARGFFDLQVAMKKSRGEEIHKMRFGGGVEEVVDRDQFREVVNSPGLSVVEFVTQRSDRCREISSFVDQLCTRYPCVHFVKVDVDENPVIAKDESVTFIPTFKIFKNGQKLKEILGPSEEALECAVKHYSF